MAYKVKSADFASAVKELLADYDQKSSDVLSNRVEATARDTVKNLRSASQSAFGQGKYSSGWTVQIEKGRLFIKAIIYGKGKTASLAHLLEYGHVTRNGTGRTFPYTPAHEHISPVIDRIPPELVRRTKDELEAIS